MQIINDDKKLVENPQDQNVQPVSNEIEGTQNGLPTSEDQIDLDGEEKISESETTPSTFTQDQVNELVGKARIEGRDSALKKLREEYGLEDINNLGEMIGKAQQYDFVNGEYENANKELGTYRQKDVLNQADVDPARYDDVLVHFKGKGIELTPETLATELNTHKEWMKQLPNSNPLAQAAKNFKNDLTPEVKSNVVVATTTDPYRKNGANGETSDATEQEIMHNMYYGNN